MGVPFIKGVPSEMDLPFIRGLQTDLGPTLNQDVENLECMKRNVKG